MTEPSENSLANPSIHLHPHSAQLSNLRVLHSFRFPNAQQTSEFVHLHSLNARPLLLSPYQCITAIQKNRHQQCLIQHPSSTETVITRDLIAPATFLPLDRPKNGATFSTSMVSDFLCLAYKIGCFLVHTIKIY